MKFKNYRNPHTQRDEIYSRNNMLDMSLRELINRQEELVAQTKVLGIPEDSELSNSENAVYVESYTRDDGTEVKAHWRSKPNSGVNINETGFNNSDFDNESKEIDMPPKYEETEEYKAEYRKLENQKSIERHDPAEIAGVRRGEPKTFLEAAQACVNPNIGDDKQSNKAYSTNCASCSIAFEAMQRGYDVEAVSGELPVIDEELSWETSGGFVNPADNSQCERIRINRQEIGCYDYFEKNMKAGERYQLVYIDREGAKNLDGGHVINITKNDKDEVIVFDPQYGGGSYGEDAKKYLREYVESQSNLPEYQVLRIDDKRFDPYYINKVVKPKNNR